MNRLPEIPEGVTALLTVEAEGICAKIRLLLKEAGEWREILSTEGFVGKNGVTDCKREGGRLHAGGAFSAGYGLWDSGGSGQSLPLSEAHGGRLLGGRSGVAFLQSIRDLFRQGKAVALGGASD